VDARAGRKARLPPAGVGHPGDADQDQKVRLHVHGAGLREGRGHAGRRVPEGELPLPPVPALRGALAPVAVSAAVHRRLKVPEDRVRHPAGARRHHSSADLVPPEPEVRVRRCLLHNFFCDRFLQRFRYKPPFGALKSDATFKKCGRF